MNSLTCIILASAILFLLIKVYLISFILCITIALFCMKIVQIFHNVDKTDDISSPSIHKNDQERIRDDFINSKNKWLCGDDYFKHCAPRKPIDLIVLPVLMDIGPRVRECHLARLETFDNVRQEDNRDFHFSRLELAEAGFVYKESSSFICCCRCTSKFKIKEIPDEKEHWHVPRCQFHVPAQVGDNTARSEVDEPRNAHNLQETNSRSEDMNTEEQTGPQETGSTQAHVVISGQLVQPTGLGHQPARTGQPQQPTVPPEDPRNAYKNFVARENSIAGKIWAVGPNTPRALAVNGLYYGDVADRLCCIACGFIIMGWYEAGRLFDVKEEHTRCSPLCGAIRHRPYRPSPP